MDAIYLLFLVSNFLDSLLFCENSLPYLIFKIRLQLTQLWENPHLYFLAEYIMYLLTFPHIISLLLLGYKWTF